MNDLNSIIIEGRLVREPVSGTSKSGKPFCFGTIASNRFYKEDPEGDTWKEATTFVDIRAFNGISEQLMKSPKGSKVRVVGRLDFFEKEGSDPHYILCEHVEIKTNV